MCRCEVSAEAPLFNTVSQSRRMQVVGRLSKSMRSIVKHKIILRIFLKYKIVKVISKVLTVSW
jgi:hypothetical protein